MTLPKGIIEKLEEYTDKYNAEENKAFWRGAFYMYAKTEEWERRIEQEAIKRAGEWFEETTKDLPIDEVYTQEIQEKYGIAYLSNIQDHWAHEFFVRVEMEKENLKKDEDFQERGFEGQDIK